MALDGGAQAPMGACCYKQPGESANCRYRLPWEVFGQNPGRTATYGTIRLETYSELARRVRAFLMVKGHPQMTTIAVSVPTDVLKRIDELRERELLSRSAWLRREVVLAVRASVSDELERAIPQGAA